MLIGSTLSAAFGLYLLALFAVEALALAGAFFEAWGRVASQRDKYSVVSYFAAVFDAIRASAAAATAATAKLEAAVAKKAVENEKDLAESLRKELDATLREPEPARRPSSSRRL